jgi:hypothetical protein
MAKAYVYDYETVVNCVLCVFINIKDPNDIKVFEISDQRNQYREYIDFLIDLIKNQTTLVSYNGLKFDNQISRFLLDGYTVNLKNAPGDKIASDVFNFAQEVIRRANQKEFPIFHPNDNPFKECDILAINNYDNPAKRSSLKWLQYSMDWHNVEDMSTDFRKPHNAKDILLLTKYCINDCLSTRELFFRNKAEIVLRSDLSKHFKMNLLNHSEPKLSKSIFLKLLSVKLKISPHILKKQKTYRKVINLNEAILPYIEFKTPELKATLSKFKKLKLDGENLKGSFKHEVTYRGLTLSFALGGIHGAKKGIYKSDKDFIIKSFDVTSFYPNLAIRNQWAPAHIDKKAFCEIYEGFFEERKKYSKKDPLNYVYKILLNSTYGLSNEDNSFLKDSMFTMRITCNGQLLLVMLIEELCESIPGARPIMVNTDGGEIIIPREYEELYHQICKEWEEQTLLQLEFEAYEKLIIPDVNNYIGIFAGKEITKEDAIKKIKNEFPKPLIKRTKDNRYLWYPTKSKGRFEVDKPLHKNKSFRIKRIAYYYYFVHNQSPEKTLEENKKIYDYCAGVRAVGSWKFFLTCMTNGELDQQSAQKTLRYYMSMKGCKILKVDGSRAIKVEASKSLERIMNKFENKEFDDYEIDTQYYLREINKEINKIMPSQQQNLFFNED